MTDTIWVRVCNFGRKAHVVRSNSTLCGRDVALFNTIVQKHPPKKCQRCLEISLMVHHKPIFVSQIS